MTIEPSTVAAQSGMATDDIRDRIEDSGATANISPKVNRRRWGIENRLRDTRDGTMAEDASRVRKNPGIMARIRSFAANI